MYLFFVILILFRNDYKAIYLCVYICKINFRRNNSYKLTYLQHQLQDIKDFNTILTFLSIYSISFIKTVMYPPWGWPTQRFETCRSPNILIVKTLYYKVVQFLVFSWIWTISARIWIPQNYLKTFVCVCVCVFVCVCVCVCVLILFFCLLFGGNITYTENMVKTILLSIKYTPQKQVFA